MRKTLLSTLAVAVLLGTSSLATAQDAAAGGAKTLATISFSGYDDALAKVKLVAEFAGNPEMAQMLEGTIQGLTAGQGLTGLDTKRPWGAVVQTAGGMEFPLVGFVPVTDLKQLLGTLAAVIGPAEDTGGGVMKIQPPDGPPLFVKEAGGWALIASKPEDLDAAPADPIKALGGLNEKYVIAALLSVKNLPATMRDEIRRNLEAGAEAIAVPMPDESQEDLKIRFGVSKRMIEEIITVLDDMDEVLVGWNVDEQNKSTYLDFQITAVEGSKTAAVFNEPLPGKTNFAGFDLPGAAVTANMASKLADSDVADMKTMLADLRTKAIKELENQGLSDAERKAATQLLGDMLDVVTTTIENKLVDGGMALMLESGALTFAAGATIGDGDKLEKVLKDLAKLAIQEDPNIAQLLKLDAETHQGVRFHTLAIPVPDEEAVKLFGETLDVVLGINETSLYVAFGTNAADVLKQAIDKSKADAGKQVPPFKLSVSLTPIVEFAASTAEPGVAMMIGMVAGPLQQSGGKDHITVTSTQIPNGGRTRLEFEAGILKLIGGAAQIFGGMGGGAAPGGFPGGPPPGGDAPF